MAIGMLALCLHPLRELYLYNIISWCSRNVRNAISSYVNTVFASSEGIVLVQYYQLMF